MNHTPGPWTLREPIPDTNVDHFKWIAKGNGQLLAQVFEIGPKGDANARLISAAPDMLKALRYADEVLANERFHPDAQVRVAIRAAIAKATGD